MWSSSGNCIPHPVPPSTRGAAPTPTVAPLDSCGRRAELATCGRNYKASNTEPLQVSGSWVTKRLLGFGSVRRVRDLSIPGRSETTRRPFREGGGGTKSGVLGTQNLNFYEPRRNGGPGASRGTGGSYTRRSFPSRPGRHATLPGVSTVDLFSKRFAAASAVREGDLRVSVHGWVE